MDFEMQKKIFLKTINHIPDLNELLININISIDKKVVAINIDNKVLNFDTDDMNVYLSSLLLFVFNNKEEIIKIKQDEVGKIIVINFINTILEELSIKEVEFEVL